MCQVVESAKAGGLCPLRTIAKAMYLQIKIPADL